MKHTHESYGILQLSRLSSGGDGSILFGSNITHRNTIRLSISPAVMESNTCGVDRFHAKNAPVIEVDMSQAQFAEAITNMNNGSGVPVTIRRLNNQPIESPDVMNKRKQFNQNFQRKTEAISKQIQHLSQNTEDILSNKKTINKTDRQTIISEINKLKQEIELNMPFILEIYNETIDTMINDAKVEIESHIAHRINQVGLNKLKEFMDIQATPKIDELNNKEPEPHGGKTK